MLLALLLPFKTGSPGAYVPYAPGGGTDVLARLVVARIGNGFGQPMVVENRRGANGVIGANVTYALRIQPVDATD